MAEIMIDILGALRSGLYATRSTTKPSSTVATTTSGAATYSGIAAAK